jgi:hypothetical protein
MRRIITISIGLLLLTGCGGKSSRNGLVSGSITYNGKPVNGATLILYSTAGQGGENAQIPVSQEGTFKNAEVPKGEYKVVVQGAVAAMQVSPESLKNIPPEKMAEVKEKLAKMNTVATIKFPDKYKSHQTTDLTCKVGDKETTLNLELKD